MNIGTRIHIPDTDVRGTVIEFRGRFIGIRLDGHSSTHYMTPETLQVWEYETPVSSPKKIPECPSAPKKIYLENIKPRGNLVPKKLMF